MGVGKKKKKDLKVTERAVGGPAHTFLLCAFFFILDSSGHQSGKGGELLITRPVAATRLRRTKTSGVFLRALKGARWRSPRGWEGEEREIMLMRVSCTLVLIKKSALFF